MYKLFIADDEAIIREGLRCLLDWETLGFTIAGEAANGDAALQFLLSETPDLVLLDIRMPGMSGLDVVRIAREHGYDGKVVILSGYSDFNYARTAIRYGVLSYLTKPIDEDELLEIVTQIRHQLDSDALEDFRPQTPADASIPFQKTVYGFIPVYRKELSHLLYFRAQQIHTDKSSAEKAHAQSYNVHDSVQGVGILHHRADQIRQAQRHDQQSQGIQEIIEHFSSCDKHLSIEQEHDPCSEHP